MPALEMAFLVFFAWLSFASLREKHSLNTKQERTSLYGIATLDTLNGNVGEEGVVAVPLLLSCPFTTKK